MWFWSIICELNRILWQTEYWTQQEQWPACTNSSSVLGTRKYKRREHSWTMFTLQVTSSVCPCMHLYIQACIQNAFLNKWSSKKWGIVLIHRFTEVTCFVIEYLCVKNQLYFLFLKNITSLEKNRPRGHSLKLCKRRFWLDTGKSF